MVSSFATKLLVVLAVTTCLAVVMSAEKVFPTLPKRPETITSPEQLKEFLQNLHEYYAIVGRPRFGRSAGDCDAALDAVMNNLLEIVMRFTRTD